MALLALIIIIKLTTNGDIDWVKHIYSVFPLIFHFGDTVPLEFDFKGHLEILGDMPKSPPFL